MAKTKLHPHLSAKQAQLIIRRKLKVGQSNNQRMHSIFNGCRNYIQKRSDDVMEITPTSILPIALQDHETIGKIPFVVTIRGFCPYPLHFYIWLVSLNLLPIQPAACYQ